MIEDPAITLSPQSGEDGILSFGQWSSFMQAKRQGAQTSGFDQVIWSRLCDVEGSDASGYDARSTIVCYVMSHCYLWAFALLPPQYLTIMVFLRFFASGERDGVLGLPRFQVQRHVTTSGASLYCANQAQAGSSPTEEYHPSFLAWISLIPLRETFLPRRATTAVENIEQHCLARVDHNGSLAMVLERPGWINST